MADLFQAASAEWFRRAINCGLGSEAGREPVSGCSCISCAMRYRARALYEAEADAKAKREAARRG